MNSKENTVLILGGNGRFGQHCTAAFAKKGWQVFAQTRSGKGLDADLAHFERVTHCPVDLENKDALTEIALQCGVIVNGLNPPYGTWQTGAPKITDATIDLAKTSGATVILPGNVYNFGAAMPELLDEKTPHRPSNPWGKIRCAAEQAYRDAGVQTIVLRIGDFLQGKPSGNWFDTHMVSKLDKGVFIYPGDSSIPHAHGYLPDAARTVVELATMREMLGIFEDIPFEGHTLTGEDMRREIEKVMARPIKLKGIPWPILRIMSLFDKDMKGVLAMRYLWNTPHRLDDTKLKRLLPGYTPTPACEMFEEMLAHQYPKTG